MIEINSTHQNEMGVDKVSTYLLSLGINLSFFLILFLPSMTRYWGIMLGVINVLYIVINRGSMQKNIYFKSIYSIVLMPLFIIITFSSLSMTTGSNFVEGIKLIFTFSLFFLNYLVLTTNTKWVKSTMNLLVITLVFFVFGTLLQMVSPNLVLEINKLHLSSGLFEQSLEFHRNGLLNGFTHQTGRNGFILSLALGYVFSMFFKYPDLKRKIFFGLLYLVLFYLLFLTGRRGFVVFNIAIVFFLIFRLLKKKWIAILLIVLTGVVFIAFLLTTDAGMHLVQRTLNQEDLSTGRFGMIEIMWSDFLERPLTGFGTYTTIDRVDFYHGHNIYFQVLRETGIFGFVTLVSFLLFSFFKTNLAISHYDNGFKKSVLIYSVYIQLLFLLLGMTENPLYSTYPLFITIVAISIGEVYSKPKKLNKINAVN